MNDTMRAVVLDAPGPPEALRIRRESVPVPRHGWVLIRVRAFGLNRSELHTRLGLAVGVTFPRVLGIEAAGVVVDCPGGEFVPGAAGAAMMAGGTGVRRWLRGVHLRPACQVDRVQERAGLVDAGGRPGDAPDSSYGSLTIGLEPAPGQVAADPWGYLLDRAWPPRCWPSSARNDGAVDDARPGQDRQP